jgi:hypothetical protein
MVDQLSAAIVAVCVSELSVPCYAEYKAACPSVFQFLG